jgi:hypothetical protein
LPGGRIREILRSMKTGRRVRPWWLLPPGRLHPLWWVAVAVVLLGLDYVTGLYVEFPVLYVIPVSIAAWYSGRWTAVALALTLPLMHIVFLELSTPAVDLRTVAETLFRCGIVVIMALWIGRLSEYERELQHHVERLEGLLAICSFCKNIRNANGEWEPLETYISKRSEAQFSHSFCPTCLERYYPQVHSAR